MNTAAPEGYYPIDLFHPGFQTLGHWFRADDAAVLDWLTAQYAGGNFLEIGTFVGCSATILAKHAKHLVCVDTWEGTASEDPINVRYEKYDVLAVCRQNLRWCMAQNRLRLWRRGEYMSDGQCRTDVLGELPRLSSLDYDLIFVDADHSYDAVKNDIEQSRKLLRPGGMLCGHDYGLFPGVTKAVDEFGKDGVAGTVWWRVIE